MCSMVFNLVSLINLKIKKNSTMNFTDIEEDSENVQDTYVWSTASQHAQMMAAT